MTIRDACLRPSKGAVTSLSETAGSLSGSQEPMPYNGIRFGPSLPRRVLPLGLFPQRPCHRGILCG